MKALEKKQAGKCAVCAGEGTQSEKRRPFVVDHCHTSGKVRALLCYRCNIMLGYLEKNEGLVEAIKAYIKAHADDVK